MNPKAEPTIRDVAAHAGVSISTVSRVLNESAAVNAASRERVTRAVAELGYKKLRVTHKHESLDLVALVANSIDNPFFLPLIEGIETTARMHDLGMLLITSPGHVPLDLDHVARLQRGGVRGFIQIGTGQDELIRKLTADRFPTVVLNHRLDDDTVSCIDSSDEIGAYQATTYLIKLGHRRIAFVQGPVGVAGAELRFSGYRRALSEHHIPFERSLVCRGDFIYPTAHEEVRRLVSAGRKFTAIFCANDQMAFGAMAALREHGVRIPDDVSVVGYDDISLSESISLTTVAQPIHDLGRNAVLLLVDLLHGRVTEPKRIVLASNLVIRGSCGQAVS